MILTNQLNEKCFWSIENVFNNGHNGYLMWLFHLTVNTIYDVHLLQHRGREGDVSKAVCNYCQLRVGLPLWDNGPCEFDAHRHILLVVHIRGCMVGQMDSHVNPERAGRHNLFLHDDPLDLGQPANGIDIYCVSKTS